MASNLTQATRYLVDRTWRSAISYGSPFFTRLLERKQVWLGGTAYEQMYETSDMSSLAQWYGPAEGLQGGSKEFIEKPHWHVAYGQIPMEQDVDEKVMNAPKGDGQLLDLAKKNAARAVQGMKVQLMQWLYSCATDTEKDALHTYPQGLVSALLEDTTYGGIARTSTAFPEWQSADEDNWDLAAAINKYNLDKWLDFCMEYATDRGEFIIIMGETLYNRLKGIMEASSTYLQKGTKAEQGFESMEYSGVEIAKDYLLDRMTYAGQTNNQGAQAILHNGSKTINADIGASSYAGLTGLNTDGKGDVGSSWVFVLDMRTWNLHYTFKNAADRAGDSIFAITDYFDQSKMLNGVEKDLARCLFKGNITCDMPNRNLMRANVD